MTKQETIAKAYGTYWKNYEGFTDENGWNWHYSSDEIDPDIFESKGSGGNFRSRPKSLAGIENNNGWIKIESEADLPDGNGTFFTMAKTSWSPFYRIDVFVGRLKNSFENGKSCFTHYQPIVKPESPIY